MAIYDFALKQRPTPALDAIPASVVGPIVYKWQRRVVSPALLSSCRNGPVSGERRNHGLTDVAEGTAVQRAKRDVHGGELPIGECAGRNWRNLSGARDENY